MSEQAPPSRLQTGIYDLGYRAYEGERLGRGYAVTALFAYSLRSVFGLGRSWVAKVFAMGLALIALIPALIQLAVAAIAPADFEITNFENYFGFVAVVLALFCAVAAPEVIGRDQRHRTLALYFSRALSRTDYVSAKILALFIGLLIVVAAPQVVIFAGNAVATDDMVEYLKSNVDEIPSIIGSTLIVAAMMSTLSLAISGQTQRRAWATGAVIIYFVITAAIGSVLFETISSDQSGYALLISPFATLEGAVFWLFGEVPDADTEIAGADIEGYYYFAAALGYTLLGMAIVYRRFVRLSV